MDRHAWQEQVEAALDGGERAMLQALAAIAPPAGLPETELVRCRLRAALGDTDGAAAAFPDLAEVEEHPTLHRPWAAAAVDLAVQGVIPNHWGLGRALTRLAEAAVERDDPAVALDILERHVAAALARGAVATARRGVELYLAVVDAEGQQAAGFSRKRRRAAEREAADMARRVDATEPADVDLPDNPDAVAALLAADPEADIRLLEAALQRWPGDVSLLHQLAHAWEALDDEAAGIEAFHRAAAQDPDDVELCTAFGWHLVRGGHLELLEEWVDGRFLPDPDPLVQARGHWLLAKARLDRAATGKARASIQRMLRLDPTSVPGRHLMAAIQRAEGQSEGALDILDALAHELPGDTQGPWHWDRMELGTQLGRWSSVRDSAARLGMPLTPGDDPVDERWSACRVHMPWATGDEQVQPAIRTGPVTARIIGLAAPDERQRYGDVVLIRAQPLDDGAHPEGPLFEAIEALSRGGYRVRAFDGHSPGDEALRAFGHRLMQLDVPLQWWVLAEPAPGAPDLHVRVGLPPKHDQAAVDAVLAQLQAALQA